MKSIYLALSILSCFILLSCHSSHLENTVSKEVYHYKKFIGDTPFDKLKDNPSFQFCDSTDVLHKRAFVRYKGGMLKMRDNFVKYFITKPSYRSFSGFFVIRFLTNCNNETDRYRMEVLDTNFQLTKPPSDLASYVLSTFMKLEGWEHPYYNDKHYDGYKFITIKIVEGEVTWE